VRAEVLAPNRLNALVFGGFAAVALTIAIVGVAGVLAFSVSARTREFGVRLAIGSAPRHLVTRVLGEGAVIATSGNLSDEPICIDEADALRRLGGIADLFLVHDRPIVRHVDDSIVRVILGREMVLRRARGYAPLPLPLPQPRPAVLPPRPCTRRPARPATAPASPVRPRWATRPPGRRAWRKASMR